MHAPPVRFHRQLCVLGYMVLAISHTALADSFAQTHWQQQLSIEARQFMQPSPIADHNQDASMSWQARYEKLWRDGDSTFTFSPFVRLNSQDDARSRFDIQTLSWTHNREHWEFRHGIRTLTWQATEAVHLVDIVNQTDLSGDIDGEDKLGQLVFNALYKLPNGTIELYALPGFRERIYPGERARLRTALPYSSHAIDYESSAEQLRTDAALRATLLLGDWEFAASHFSGTSREPVLRVANGKLASYYPVIDQTGLELQFAAGDWLWKLEAISRSGFDDPFGNGFARYEAAAAGFEFTWSGLGDSGYDLGILTEYLWDGRRDQALSNDIFVGTRLGLNDIASTDLLVGWIQDADHGEYLGFVEFSRRVRDTGKLEVTARFIGSPQRYESRQTHAELLSLHRDDYLTAQYTHYF